MGVLGFFDFMLVNGRVAWNIAVTDTTTGFCHFVLPNWKFWLILCEQLISFHDKHSINIAPEEALAALASKIQGHNPGPVPKGFVGGLSHNFQKRKEIDRASKYAGNIT